MVFFELPLHSNAKSTSQKQKLWMTYKEVVKNHTKLKKEEDPQKASLTSLTIKACMYFFWTVLDEISGSWQGKSLVSSTFLITVL